MSKSPVPIASGPAWDVFDSPIGPLTLEMGPAGLRALRFPGRPLPRGARLRSPRALAPVRAQLAEYFAGQRLRFDIELDLRGGPLQLAVWERLLAIPYGRTTTYGEIGAEVGQSNARAIGRCVGSTPVPIIVPCHRVIGADGSLRGYGGGLSRKESLLGLEQGVRRRSRSRVSAKGGSARDGA
jgi:methylated-DNA-[protein]-cysteine S-methyltransferase